MAKRDAIDMDELRKIVRELSEIMEECELSELSYEREGFKISLKRASALPHPPPITEVRRGEEQPVVTERVEEFDYITAPMPGTFYRAPAPGAEPFVREGDIVRGRSEEYEGDTLCIIEAMKVMNEIKAEFDCQIIEILAENGQRVEYGQKLFKVKRR